MTEARDWRSFVLEHGWHARRDHLAHVLGVPVDAVDALRRRAHVCRPGARQGFAELFTLWHGRPPADEEWPAPRPRTCRGGITYEWQAPELALVASLVGRVGPGEIRQVLAERLRRVTGDPAAGRSRYAVQNMINRIGLQASDVVGGLTVAEAARRIGTRSILDHYIRRGKIRIVTVGRLHVIPHEEFERFRAGRVFRPQGYVRLAPLKRALGIRSDKLSEWARMGYVPSAIRCNPTGTHEHSTQFGTWYIDPKVARKLLADRRAGRPMPWWGKPTADNLRRTYALWLERRHPTCCTACRDIWGAEGPPATREAYYRRYPPLEHGAKRHLSRPWCPGLTPAEVATASHVSRRIVLHAIAIGVLRATKFGRRWFVSKTDAVRWKWRRCTTGDHAKSWLSISSACRFYGFTHAEVDGYIASDRLRVKVGCIGAQRDVRYVLKQQVRDLRDELGYSEREAARRLRVSVARLRVLLRGLEWRTAPRIPADVVHAAAKRQVSLQGATFAEVARILRKPVSWVRREVYAGTIRPLRAKWHKHRLYVSMPQFKRLCEVALEPPKRERWSIDWLLVSDAAQVAGVSIGTVMRWAEAGEVSRRRSPTGWRYHRRSVMHRARSYWRTQRFKRAVPPAWLVDEQRAHQSSGAAA